MKAIEVEACSAHLLINREERQVLRSREGDLVPPSLRGCEGEGVPHAVPRITDNLENVRYQPLEN
jgi:hypothetical protein